MKLRLWYSAYVLLFGLGFFLLSIYLQGRPIQGELVGIHAFLGRHIWLFGAAFFFMTLLNFAGELARSRNRKSAHWLRAALLFAGATWLIALASSELLGLLRQHSGQRFPPDAIRGALSFFGLGLGVWLAIRGMGLLLGRGRLKGGGDNRVGRTTVDLRR